MTECWRATGGIQRPYRSRLRVMLLSAELMRIDAGVRGWVMLLLLDEEAGVICEGWLLLCLLRMAVEIHCKRVGWVVFRL